MATHRYSKYSLRLGSIEFNRMEEYFVTEGETKQGITVQLVLSFTHRLYESSDRGLLTGQLEVFTDTQYFNAQFSQSQLNQDVEWDGKYLKLIDNAFKSEKERTLGLDKNVLTVTIQLNNKSIKLTILTFRLETRNTSPFLALTTSILHTNSHLQSLISLQKSTLKEYSLRNSKIQKQSLQFKRNASEEIDRIKEQFVLIVNEVKMKNRRRMMVTQEKKEEEVLTETGILKKQHSEEINEEIANMLF